MANPIYHGGFHPILGPAAEGTALEIGGGNVAAVGKPEDSFVKGGFHVPYIITLLGSAFNRPSSNPLANSRAHIETMEYRLAAPRIVLRAGAFTFHAALELPLHGRRVGAHELRVVADQLVGQGDRRVYIVWIIARIVHAK